MKREYPETPLVGVGAVILDQGRVVLVKRKFPPLAGDWSIPGGRLKIGETLREGVVREAREETGLTVDPVELLGVYDRLLLDEAGRILYHYVLIDFLCRRLTGELQASGDADDARWFSPEEIEKVSLVADTAQVIRLGFEKVGK
ncbi:MAG: NUDIX hydrolase [Acidobacteria bacterium]|nr:MAG: NUDIX hydrolase [Acidobacteriales bacterium 13_2_20CM_2_55_5]PYV98417.1 MAG: NUDIX hydrolase [Acidobacteriota bacterium]PYX12643.1 MAG: NUDIX hydrolase [Acidobacteriota bacterium]PYX13929.1 MAG: NUDIX hydrolase [Acidobacteriota bacterium]